MKNERLADVGSTPGTRRYMIQLRPKSQTWHPDGVGHVTRTHLPLHYSVDTLRDAFTYNRSRTTVKRAS
jgi:hypothetical protein